MKSPPIVPRLQRAHGRLPSPDDVHRRPRAVAGLMMKPFHRLAAFCVLASTACGVFAADEKPAAPKSSKAVVIEPYMRVTNAAPGVVELQIALRKFAPTNGAGPVVWLAAVSHIGESNYYAAVQKHLDAQALVLFEGVKPGPMTNASAAKKSSSDTDSKSDSPKNEKPPANNSKPDKKSSKAGDAASTDAKTSPAKHSKTSSLQHTLAESLGLMFQLEAIDYERPNFRNSDLTITEVQQLIEDDDDAKPGADKKKNETFQRLLKAMDGSSVLGAILQGGIKLIGTSPKLQGMTRLALIETLGALRGDPSQMRGLPQDMQTLVRVLIHSRNTAVLKDLRAEMEKSQPPKSVSIFYGAGHMEEMEQRLRREFKYAPAETVWLPAFSVDLEKSDLSKIEAELIRTMVRRQLETLVP
ncbi:MAG: hypothetical protein HY300_20190 [Verrucomicrobia bacterium]|nr:hypothetical protein [Verrucomicrobiota bacterium]